MATDNDKPVRKPLIGRWETFSTTKRWVVAILVFFCFSLPIIDVVFFGVNKSILLVSLLALVLVAATFRPSSQ